MRKLFEGGSRLGSNKEVGSNQATCLKEIRGHINNEQELDSNYHIDKDRGMMSTSGQKSVCGQL